MTNEEAIRRRRKARKMLALEFPDCEYIGGVGWTGPGWRDCEKRHRQLNVEVGLTADGLTPLPPGSEARRLEEALVKAT